MNKEIKRLTKEFDEVLKPITPKVLESILPESVEEPKDWTKSDENGDVDVPDYLMPLLNKLGFQLRFHTISGEGEVITLVRMTSIAEKFFKTHHSAEAKWQLCPKCNGTGQMYINEAMTNPMNTSCRIGYHTCDVCGAGKHMGG